MKEKMYYHVIKVILVFLFGVIIVFSIKEIFEPKGDYSTNPQKYGVYMENVLEGDEK